MEYVVTCKNNECKHQYKLGTFETRIDAEMFIEKNVDEDILYNEYELFDYFINNEHYC